MFRLPNEDDLAALAAAIAHMGLSTLPEAAEIAGHISQIMTDDYNRSREAPKVAVQGQDIAGHAAMLVDCQDKLTGTMWWSNMDRILNEKKFLYDRSEATDANEERTIDLARRAMAWASNAMRSAGKLEKDQKAFSQVGKQGCRTRNAIADECEEIGCSRIIVAEFGVGVWGETVRGRRVRSVAIGFGQGSQESFAQLRKAAGGFVPTSRFGPGRDGVTVFSYGASEGVRRRQYVPVCVLSIFGSMATVFESEQEASAQAEKAIALFRDGPGVWYRDRFAEHAAAYGYRMAPYSYEHREGVSTCGCDCLGVAGDYGVVGYDGWKVRSVAVPFFRGEELHEITDFDRGQCLQNDF